MYEWYYLFIVLIIGWIIGVFNGSKWPLPFFEKGHRFFGVVNNSAQKSIVAILKDNGIGPWKTFEAGITNQVIMNDMQTVIGYFKKDIGDLPKHVISIPVKDPEKAAQKAWEELFNNGFETSVHQPLGEDIPFYLIKTNAFLDGGGIAFRLSVFKMPKPEWIPNPV